MASAAFGIVASRPAGRITGVETIGFDDATLAAGGTRPLRDAETVEHLTLQPRSGLASCGVAMAARVDRPGWHDLSNGSPAKDDLAFRQAPGQVRRGAEVSGSQEMGSFRNGSSGKGEEGIGIALVGLFDPKARQYETVTSLHNASLKWIIGELQRELKLDAREVFRHPEVSYKEQTEASSANWK